MEAFMSERKLAHIERVIDLQPIQGADRIETATVLGWQCVVKKGEVKVGDLVCYIEIDSIVPDIPYFDFMKERNFRVRTIKLRKQISQGLIVPCKQYKDGCLLPLGLTGTLAVYREGDDVTEALGIVKYESQSDKESSGNFLPKKKYPWYIRYLTRYQWFRQLTGMKSKSFPDWISKTDETRLQNMPFVLNDKSQTFYITEKLDGQSATYWYKHHWLNPEFGICSRTVRKSESDGSNWSVVAKKLQLKQRLKAYYSTTKKQIAIQGEIIGDKIQGNKYKIDGFDFYVFNVFFIDEKRYANISEIQWACRQLDLKTVPLIEDGFVLKPTVQEMVELSKGKSILYPVDREGIVVRSHDQQISFKVINPDFLLKNEE